MITSFKLLSLLLLTALSLQQCTQGCLKCGSNKTCLICNFYHGYVNVNGSCQIQVDTRCITQGVDGKCLQCNHGYRLDYDTYKCVVHFRTLENCLYQTDNGACKYCSFGFYPSEYQCLAVTTQVANCKYHLDNHRCQVCDPQYSLSSDFKLCAKDPEISGCSLQNNFQCKTCKSGYFKNPNNYVASLLSQNSSNEIHAFLLSLQYHVVNSNIPDPCEKIVLLNCDTPVSATQCGKCASGYYLAADQTCKLHPLLAISNCVEYQDFNVCSQCDNGYIIFDSARQCKQHITLQANCLTHSQVQDNTCSVCQTQFFLTGNGCQQRVDSLTIAQCATTSSDSDTCKACNHNFRVTDDGKKCLPVIQNCKSYATTSTKDSLLHTCTTCENGTYAAADGKTCLPGSISNCDTYTSQSQCAACKNKYYLNLAKDVCTYHTDLQNCSVYSPDTARTCATCDSNYFVFNQTTICQLPAGIEQCKKYSSSSTCTECNDYYFLYNNTKCTKIPTENCVKADNTTGVCSQCKQTHFLNTLTAPASCNPHYNYQMQNCLKQKDDITNNLVGHIAKYECAQCKSGFLFKEITETNNLCLETSKLLGVNLIEGCVKYKFMNPGYLCAECAENYFFDISRGPDNILCIKTCPYFIREFLHFGSGPTANTIQYRRRNQCESTPTDYNKVYSSDSSAGETNLVIGHCENGSFGVYQNTPTTYDYDQAAFSYSYSFPTYEKCVNASLVTSYPSYFDNTYNCKQYREIDDNGIMKYFCETCKHGYTGKIIEIGGQKYVTCDTAIPNCSAQKYGGFLLNTQSEVDNKLATRDFFSCHSCTGVGQIPILFTPMKNNIEFEATQKPFTLTAATPTDTPGDGFQLQCLSPVRGSFGMAEADFTQTFIPNCGLAMFNTDKAKSYTKTLATDTLFCVECAPGHKKAFDATSKVVTSCTAIPSCDTTATHKWFNSCSKCLSTHTWGWSAARQIHYDECILKQVPNCLVSETATPTTCKVCEKGFDLIDNKCEKYTVAKCKSFLQNSVPFFNAGSATDGTQTDSFWLAAYMFQNPGCEYCVDDSVYNYVSVEQPTGTHQTCVGSYIEQNLKATTTSDIILNCASYSVFGKKCIECSQGYILHTDGLSCVVSTGYENCKTVGPENANTVCKSCVNNYYLILNKCVQGQIVNCVGYDPAVEAQTCTKCADYYRPAIGGKSCILGHLNYCRVYDNKTENSCLTCDEKASVFRYQVGTNDQYLCHPLQEDLNCETFTSPLTSNKIQTYTCSQCKAGYFLSSDMTNVNKTRCITLAGTIFNCVKYSTANNDFFQNNFKCLQCSVGYYVSSYGYNCEKRLAEISNCTAYHLSEETCTTCASGFYLSALKTECLKKPTGIAQCTDYTDDVTCKACAKDFYLQANKCVSIPALELIPQCLTYSAEKKCLSCNVNFVLMNNACIAAVATSCSTYTDEKTCLTCPNHHYLVKSADGKVTSCQLKQLLNCKILDATTGKCATCENQTFVNATGECQLATLINNCSVYATINTCQMCAQEYFLAEDLKSCVRKGQDGLQAMENCADVVYTAKKECLVCKEGYYFSNGQCSKCKNGDSCAVCDEKNQDICYLCHRDFHQTEYQKNCVKSKLIEFAPVPKDPETKTRGLSFQRISLLLATLFLF